MISFVNTVNSLHFAAFKFRDFVRKFIFALLILYYDCRYRPTNELYRYRYLYDYTRIISCYFAALPRGPTL